MNLIQLINKITGVYEANPVVNTVKNGDPYNHFNNSQIKYMAIAFDVMSADVNDNLLTYNFRIYCADRLTDTQDNSNFVFQNTMTQILDGLHTLEKDEDIIEINYPRHFDFAKQKFMDVLGCSYCDFSVTVVNDFDKC